MEMLPRTTVVSELFPYFCSCCPLAPTFLPNSSHKLLRIFTSVNMKTMKPFSFVLQLFNFYQLLEVISISRTTSQTKSGYFPAENVLFPIVTIHIDCPHQTFCATLSWWKVLCFFNCVQLYTFQLPLQFLPHLFLCSVAEKGLGGNTEG